MDYSGSEDGLEFGKESYGFIKGHLIFWLAGRLLDSQVGICCMGLVNYNRVPHFSQAIIEVEFAVIQDI
jgi:hypothetical protein